MSLSALNVPAEERTTIIEGIKQQDLRSIAKAAVKQLFDVLSDTFDLELKHKYSARKNATRKSPPNNSPKDAGLLSSCGAAVSPRGGLRVSDTNYPSSGMAEADGPSVSLNGVVVALVVRRNQIDLCAINSAVAPPCSVTG